MRALDLQVTTTAITLSGPHSLAQAMTPTALLTWCCPTAQMSLRFEGIWQIHHRVLTVPSWKTISHLPWFCRKGVQIQRGEGICPKSHREKGIKHGSTIPLRAVHHPQFQLEADFGSLALELCLFPLMRVHCSSPLGIAGSAFP